MSETFYSQETLQRLAEGLLSGRTVAQAAGISQKTLERLYALAHGLYSSGNYTDAQVMFQALSIYAPNEYRFWMGLAGCRQALEQYQAAIEAYQMAAVATSLKNPEPLLFAVNCLIKLGRKDEAKAGIETLLNIGSDDLPQNKAVHDRARALLTLLQKA